MILKYGLRNTRNCCLVSSRAYTTPNEVWRVSFKAWRQRHSCQSFANSRTLFFGQLPSPCWPNTFVVRQFSACSSLHASKNRGKDKTKTKSPQVSAEELQEVVDFSEYESGLKNLVTEFRDLLSKQFALRTSSASFEAVTVDIDGKKTPLNSLVQITFKTPQLVMLNLAANPTYIPAVVKAIETSGLNLSPQIEGHVVYISVPKVARDHRESLVKNAKAASNKFKERIRAVQNSYVRTAKDKSDVSEDLVRNVVIKIMAQAESTGKELDAALAAKEKELLAVQ